jgi:hypothetical protein
MRANLRTGLAILAGSLAAANAASAQQGPVTTPPGQCLSADQLHDLDGDATRNRGPLSGPELCIRLEVFREGGFNWILQIIQNRRRPNGPLWAVPHDDEDASFTAGVYAVTRYGGTMVAVEAAGERFNPHESGDETRRQDPNRNFDAGSGAKCRFQRELSPEFTKRFLRWRPRVQPIIALHTNERGYKGDGKDGEGNLSMARPLGPASHMTRYRAAKPIDAISPDDTMVFVASRQRAPGDAALARFIGLLNARGVHVIHEEISARYDCSLSNHAALRGIRNYVNIEAVHGDTGAQVAVIDVVMRLLAAGQGPARLAVPRPAAKKGR